MGTTWPDAYRRFVRFLNARREYSEAVLLDGAPELDGSYTGDGIPRTVGGQPYEPLEWGEVRRSGTD